MILLPGPNDHHLTGGSIMALGSNVWQLATRYETVPQEQPQHSWYVAPVGTPRGDQPVKRNAFTDLWPAGWIPWTAPTARQHDITLRVVQPEPEPLDQQYALSWAYSRRPEYWLDISPTPGWAHTPTTGIVIPPPGQSSTVAVGIESHDHTWQLILPRIQLAGVAMPGRRPGVAEYLCTIDPNDRAGSPIILYLAGISPEPQAGELHPIEGGHQ